MLNFMHINNIENNLNTNSSTNTFNQEINTSNKQTTNKKNTLDFSVFMWNLFGGICIFLLILIVVRSIFIYF